MHDPSQFEVKGGQDRFQYWINGTAGTVTETGPLESTLGGFPIHFRAVSKKQNLFRVTNFAPGVAVALETYNDFVRVNIHSSANGPHFAGSVGLMGSYPTGTKGVVQHPEECEMPKNVAASRRLREGALDTTDAKAACAHVRAPKEREACIFDVLATNDRDMASSYTV
ncbi:expressed unknown protein [Seminavis robusta]|uniref:VWFD domain-containing protein n=1 Tax=Seminavis robusta TaxID=568900 RepID=A0A9N8D8L4_9STRA|nr:expressed unknown protein [Seminavis robusta]|eukprot:Sro16_g011710.1 n/a (168) ;mRNA; f:78236-78841